MKQKKEQEILAEMPAFSELRNMVSNANEFVDNLERCSDNFRTVVDDIKDKLRKANWLVVSLEKAQKEMVLKMLDVDWSDAAIQVRRWWFVKFVTLRLFIQ